MSLPAASCSCMYEREKQGEGVCVCVCAATRVGEGQSFHYQDQEFLFINTGSLFRDVRGINHKIRLTTSGRLFSHPSHHIHFLSPPESHHVENNFFRL